MAEKTRVIVTGVGGGGHGHELVKCLKLAGGYHIIGLDMSPTSFGLLDVDEGYLVPSAGDPAYLATLFEACKKYGAQVLLTGSEPELKVVSAHRQLFADAGILLLFNSERVIDIGLDKMKTLEFLKANGFPHPQYRVVTDRDSIPADFPLPAVVKPAVGGGGSKNLYLVQEQAELQFACELLLKQGQMPMLQEYVGTPEDEFTVGVLHTLQGNFVGSIAIHRHIMSGLSNFIKTPNRTKKTKLGILLAISSGVSQGDVKDYANVRAACEGIASALKSQGPINIQCRFVDGVLLPFEINPRFSGTSFQRALVGYNEVDLMIRHHLHGEPMPAIEFKHGAVLRALEERFVPEGRTFPKAL